MIDHARLLDALKAAGLPVAGGGTYDGGDGVARFRPAPGVTLTRDQQEQADAILRGPLGRPRRRLTPAACVAAVQGLSDADLRRLTVRALAEMLAADPGLGERAGLAVRGDEPA